MKTRNDKIEDLSNKAENTQKFSSWKQRTQTIFKQIRQLIKEDPSLSFSDAARKVGLIKDDKKRETD